MIRFQSPCVGICEIDDDGLCLGCKRTDEEIFKWLTYNEEERIEKLKEMKQRTQQPRKQK